MKNRTSVCIFFLLAMSILAGCGKTAPETSVPTKIIPTASFTETEVPSTASKSTPAPLSEANLLFRSTREGDYFDLYAMSLDGTNILRLTSGETGYEPCGWSPDGNKILFTGWGNTETFVGIMNADGTGLTDLTNDPDHSYACGSWSADGSQIVYLAYLNENNDIFVMSADGS